MKLLIRIVMLASLVGILPGIATAWDGYDSDTGSYVEIDKGNLVRPGREIEIYDSESGEYKEVEVQSIRSNGSGAEVEIYDYEAGETRTLEMD